MSSLLYFSKRSPHVRKCFATSRIIWSQITKQEIIMEDVRERKHVNCLRTNMLDFEHCKAAMQTLASYHAASLVLTLKDPEYFQELTDSVHEIAFPSDSGPCVGKCTDAGLELTIRCLEFDSERKEQVHQLIDILN